jgi:hypothetical protein
LLPPSALSDPAGAAYSQWPVVCGGSSSGT